MDKLDFHEAYLEARKQPFTLDTIKNMLGVTGLTPTVYVETVLPLDYKKDHGHFKQS